MQINPLLLSNAKLNFPEKFSNGPLAKRRDILELNIYDDPIAARRCCTRFSKEIRALVWHGNLENNFATSLDSYIEKNFAVLKAGFIDWIHDIGDREQRDISIKEVMSDSIGTYWHLSLVHQKCEQKTPELFLCFQIFSLSQFLSENSYTGIKYLGNNPKIKACFRESSWSIRRYLNKYFLFIHQFCRGVGYLLYYVSLYIQPILSKAPEISSSYTVFSYFPNLRYRIEEQPILRPKVWGNFPELLLEEDQKATICWILIYVKDSNYGVKRACRNLQKVNLASSQESAYLAQQFLGLPGVAKIFFKFCKLCIRWRTLPFYKGTFTLSPHGLNLQHAFARSWYSSLIGLRLVDNLILQEQFSSISKAHKVKSIAYYPWENHIWEKVLLQNRSKYSLVVAQQHASLSPGLLSFFESPKAYIDKKFPLPIPDFLAVNGPVPMKLLIESGFPNSRLIELEALRYQNLVEMTENRVSRKELLESTNKKNIQKTLVFFASHIRLNASNDLKRIFSALATPDLNQNIKLVIKPHPHCPALDSTLSVCVEFGIKATISNDTPSNLLKTADYVITGSHTSCSIEALYAGIPTAVLTETSNFICSPAYGLKDCIIARSEVDILNFLKNAPPNIGPCNYFYLGENYQRWRTFLSQVSISKVNVTI